MNLFLHYRLYVQLSTPNFDNKSFCFILLYFSPTKFPKHIQSYQLENLSCISITPLYSHIPQFQHFPLPPPFLKSHNQKAFEVLFMIIVLLFFSSFSIGKQSLYLTLLLIYMSCVQCIKFNHDNIIYVCVSFSCFDYLNFVNRT